MHVSTEPLATQNNRFIKSIYKYYNWRSFRMICWNGPFEWQSRWRCGLQLNWQSSTEIFERRCVVSFRFIEFLSARHLICRVFKYQVYFLKVVQLGAPWTNLHKFFFSDFLKVYIFCQVTKKKDFYSITAATIAECWIEILHFIEKRWAFCKNCNISIQHSAIVAAIIL